MLFNSYIFIFAFLPLVWGGFHLLKAMSIRHNSIKLMNLAKGFLVLSSLFFYAFFKAIYLPILLGSIVINFILARLILRSTTTNSIVFNGGGGEAKAL